VTKVAVFLPALASGGAEKVMLNLAGGLLERGFAVELVLLRREGAFLPLLPPGASLVDLGARRALTALPGLVRYLRRTRLPVFLSNLTYLNMLAVIARALAGTPTRLVLVEHSDLRQASLHGVRRWERFFPQAVRFFYPRAGAVVAVSRGVADGLIREAGLPSGLITVVHNPIVTPEIDSLAKAPLEHPWFTPGGPPVLLATGRLTVSKDYPALLQAFAILREQLSLRLVVLGEGELKGELEALAQELGVAQDVDFAGFDPNPYRYMARCAVFVLSSAWEGFGNVLVEALACGAQVVATDCPGGPAEILAGGSFGRLVPVGDPAALARAILSALQKPLPAESLRRRAADFTVQAVTGHYLDVLFPTGDVHVG
jgi:glycosyltransferase involved in cell wall biosynthesis